MQKELYVKPEITSEILEPGALGSTGSGGGGDKFMLQFLKNPSAGLCCEN